MLSNGAREIEALDTTIRSLLRNTLASVYDNHREITRVLCDAGIDVRLIALNGTPIVNWHEALNGAEKQGRLAALITVVREEYPAKINPILPAVPAPPVQSSQVVTRIDSSSYVEFIHQPGRSLVYVSAQWIAACAELKPIVAEAAQRFGDRVRIADLDVSDSVAFIEIMGFDPIPIILYFVDGVCRAALRGDLPPARIAESLRKLME